MNGPPDWQSEPSPVVPHLAAEFLLWLWWCAERTGGVMDLGEELGSVDFWVDERLAFRAADDGKAAAVITGENPADSLEAKAAVAGGKVLRELRLGLRRDEREFAVTLKAPLLDLAGLRLPQVVRGQEEEALYDRMFLYEELHSLLVGLFAMFASQRLAPSWEVETVPDIRAWIAGGARS